MDVIKTSPLAGFGSCIHGSFPRCFGQSTVTSGAVIIIKTNKYSIMPPDGSSASMRSLHYCHLLSSFLLLLLLLTKIQSNFSIKTILESKVYQMLSRYMKNSLNSLNIWDTVTKVLLLCSVHQAPSYGPNLTLLVPFPTEFPYLSMLFILGMVCSEDHLKNK